MVWKRKGRVGRSNQNRRHTQKQHTTTTTATQPCIKKHAPLFFVPFFVKTASFPTCLRDLYKRNAGLAANGFVPWRSCIDSVSAGVLIHLPLLVFHSFAVSLIFQLVVVWEHGGARAFLPWSCGCGCRCFGFFGEAKRQKAPATHTPSSSLLDHDLHAGATSRSLPMHSTCCFHAPLFLFRLDNTALDSPSPFPPHSNTKTHRKQWPSFSFSFIVIVSTVLVQGCLIAGWPRVSSSSDANFVCHAGGVGGGHTLACPVYVWPRGEGGGHVARGPLSWGGRGEAWPLLSASPARRVIAYLQPRRSLCG